MLLSLSAMFSSPKNALHCELDTGIYELYGHVTDDLVNLTDRSNEYTMAAV